MFNLLRYQVIIFDGYTSGENFITLPDQFNDPFIAREAGLAAKHDENDYVEVNVIFPGVNDN